MGHGPIALQRLLDVGVEPGLSVDTCTNVAGDLFGPMRTAIALTRAHANAQALEQGGWVEAEPMPVAQALHLATRAGALANGLPATGELAVGRRADVVVVSTEGPNLVPAGSPIAAIVMGAHPGNVDSVWIDGRAVKRGGRLLMPDYEQLREQVARRNAELLAH
jgi:cytosine/adenosine deaminase-related metal-dependent hydrolase